MERVQEKSLALFRFERATNKEGLPIWRRR